MINTIIINEFNKLIKFIEYNLNKSTDNKEKIANTFRLKQIKNILSIIKKYPEEINLINIKDFSKLDGIGIGTINRIKEILKNGFLEELKDFNFDNTNNKIFEELESIIGIGKTNAQKLINKGITSIEDLKNKILNNEIKVNDKILLGLKYEGVFKNNIPRKEINNIYNVLKNIINNINNKYNLNDNNKYIFEICGSYRREKDTSNDIDILISKLNTNTNGNNLKIIINELKISNNNELLLIDDITDKNIKTKYMGFCRYKDNPVRRIDIRFVPFKSYYTALLYFTGSKDLNTKMRIKAHELGYKLSEYSLIDINKNKKIKINSEYDIFKLLKMEYLQPNLR
jgi:DNA polymerase/3'-5' exonuclease PolX